MASHVANPDKMAAVLGDVEVEVVRAGAVEKEEEEEEEEERIGRGGGNTAAAGEFCGRVVVRLLANMAASCV